MDNVDDGLVSVFKTDDPGLLPLAKITLESAGIEYQARSFGKVDNLQWTLSQTPTIRATVTEILVTSDVADRARDLLADLTKSQTVAATDPALLTDSAEAQAIRLEVVDSGTPIGVPDRRTAADTRQSSRRGRPAEVSRGRRSD